MRNEANTHKETIMNNKMCSASLNNNISGIEKLNYKNSQREGFNRIKDGNGNYIASVEDSVDNTYNKGVGADWVEPNILNAITKSKYTYLSAQEVGPKWMR
jgi:hypothetical protein